MEYKFRVWDYDEKKMYYQDDLIITFDKVGEDVYVYKNGTVEPLYNYKIMQYAGRKDRNEVEIYQDDIAWILNDTPQIIELDKGVTEMIDGCWQINGYSLYSHYKTLVVGNVYENPELLEEKYEN